MRRPRDQKGFLRRKGTVDRVPVKLVDPGGYVRFSQEPVTEKIQGLNTVGDTGGDHDPGKTGTRGVGETGM